MNTKSKMLLTSVSITSAVLLLFLLVVIVVCLGGVCPALVGADNGQTGRNHTVSAAGEVQARPHDASQQLDNAQKQQINQNMGR